MYPAAVWPTVLPLLLGLSLPPQEEVGPDFQSQVDHRIRTLDKQFGNGFFRYFCDDGVMPRPYLVAYELRKNEDPETVERELAEILTHLREQFFLRFGDTLGLTEIRRPVVVVVFSDFDSYVRVWKKRPRDAIDMGLQFPFEGLQGFYDPRNGRLYLWGQKDDAEFWRVAFHEGTHQLVDQATGGVRTMQDYPKRTPWLQEGIADFMGGHTRELVPNEEGGFTTVFRLGQFLEDRYEAARVAHLTGNAFSLRDLAYYDGESFARLQQSGNPNDFVKALLVYAQGWALCKFMNDYDGGRYREAFADLLRADAELNGGGDTFARILGLETEADWKQFEDTFWEWFERDLGAQSRYGATGGGSAPSGPARLDLAPESRDDRLGAAILLARDGDLVGARDASRSVDQDDDVTRQLEALADYESDVLAGYRRENRRTLRLSSPDEKEIATGKVAGFDDRTVTLKARSGEETVPRSWFGLDDVLSGARKLKIRDPALDTLAYALLGSDEDTAVRRGKLAGSALEPPVRERMRRFALLMERAAARRAMERLTDSTAGAAETVRRLDELVTRYGANPAVREHADALVAFARSLLEAAYRESGLIDVLGRDLEGEVSSADGLATIRYSFDDPRELRDFVADVALPQVLVDVLGRRRPTRTPVVSGGKLRLTAAADLRFRHAIQGRIRVRCVLSIDGSNEVTLLVAPAERGETSFAAYVGLAGLVYSSGNESRARMNADVEIEARRDYEIVMSVEPGRITVACDGQTEHEAIDATVDGGYVALLVRGDAVVEVSELEIAGMPDPTAFAGARDKWIAERLEPWKVALGVP